MALPKFSKESKTTPNGERIDSRYLTMLRLLKENVSPYNLLFERLPKAFGYEGTFSSGLVENIVAAKDFYDNLLHELEDYLIEQTKDIFMLKQNQTYRNKMSLYSIVKEWCDSIEPTAFDHLFPDGTEKCLSLFKTVTNDESTFILRLAKVASGLRIEDWDNSVISKFTNRLKQYRTTAEGYKSENQQIQQGQDTNYRVTFVDDDGSSVTKSFERIDYSKRGKLLYNQIMQSLDSMGHAISEQEKRQVIMEILKNLC